MAALSYMKNHVGHGGTRRHCTYITGYTINGEPIHCGIPYRLKHRKNKLPLCSHHLRSHIQQNRCHP